MSGEQVHADARRVIDWYRERLETTTHDLAFASSALAETRDANAAMRAELGEIRRELDALQAATVPAPESNAFPAWVAEHWEQIEDARLAHSVEHASGQHEAAEMGS